MSPARTATELRRRISASAVRKILRAMHKCLFPFQLIDRSWELLAGSDEISAVSRV